jgi:hypothetical protein
MCQELSDSWLEVLKNHHYVEQPEKVKIKNARYNKHDFHTI